ncbi:nuclease-related domain-containing protein [Burkholderia sp. Ax-1719]|uniref:nuclease-related domain-containing protein n=1 Tax=Burkholderia sp. Ax-1719 TaxID=2608334 RepID=UPI001421F44A|nr:nuclease-related domain-containing protein [Burkholderia sp. Ax-1719]NIE64473.1 NERD domain-containing protein [Burkholderia sp. Ax-1719]
MARILPDGWKALRTAGGAARELETLEQLETGLPDDYTVYHSVHWTRLAKGLSVFGDLDFVVVSPSGRIMAIGQKAGCLEEITERLAKTYSGKPKSVTQQISRSVSALRDGLSDAFTPRNYGVEELLYCPDYTVINRDIAGVHPAHIVDATRGKWLADIVQQILPADEPPLPCHDGIHQFLTGELSLMPDVGAMIGAASKLMTQVSSGLATWARNIHFEAFRLRVNGTAGLGKPQLAIGVLHGAVAAGKRALYVCLNRQLVDYVGSIAPEFASVMSVRAAGVLLGRV